MQTVPSLVGTGTAIAAAASGLVFGHPNDNDPDRPLDRRVLHKRNASLDPSPTRNGTLASPAPSRPGTSPPTQAMAAADDLNHSTLPRPASRSRPPLSRYQRPQSSQFPGSRPSPRTNTLGNDTQVTAREPLSYIHTNNTQNHAQPQAHTQAQAHAQPTDSRRNSLSSTGSWMRRLSLRPLSQHGSSPRSSIVADRQSVTMSHSSTAPILRPKTAAAQLPPNKLVKRSSSTQNHDPQQISRSKSKGHLPTLRRPATSHQRSATLQQFRLNAQEGQDLGSSDGPRYSFEQRPSYESTYTASHSSSSQPLAENIQWSSFFHSRRTMVPVDGRPSTGGPHAKTNTVRRISAKAATACQNTVHLIKPKMVTSVSMPSLRLKNPTKRLAEPAEIVPEQAEQEEHAEQQPQPYRRDQHAQQPPRARRHEDDEMGPTEMGSEKDQEGSRDGATERPSSSMRMKRSLSTSFATVAGHLVSRTSGSLRRSKRGERQQLPQFQQQQPMQHQQHQHLHARQQGTSPLAPVSGERRHASAPISGSPAVLAGVDHDTTAPRPPIASPRQARQGPPAPLAPRAVSASAATELHQRRQRSQQRPQHPQHPHHRPQRSPSATTTTTSSDPSQGAHKRNLSSPLPPPPQRPLNFHSDLASPRAASFSPVFGAPGGVVAAATTTTTAATAVVHPVRPLQPSTSSTASSAMSTSASHQRPPYHDHSPLMDPFDADARGFISGDDDDTDFKSDTLYDSLRTVASSRGPRQVDTPLESVYDESPPSTASNGKSRRLSIHEMLDKAWDGDDRITEEDETLHTPVRAPSSAKVKSSSTAGTTGTTTTNRHDAARNGHSPRGTDPDDLRLSVNANPIQSSFPSREFGRMSLEDDFDDDWARYEDEADSHISPLSAPSKSSLNAKGMNPNVRLALANMDAENAPASDRPLSNIFDWSEPSTQDKHDAERRSGRPQTAYGKQLLDPRGGRSSSRRGPAPAHVRSQSVPVVHDGADDHKPAGAKYGTWGLGTKTVSEDWDEDFEFGSSVGNDDRDNEEMFAVPESIRASQPSVKAHSGQIRELSLLVNDLKRLCRHARDMGLLEGSQKALWKEAEGVIALASPDDETMDDDLESNPSVDLDAFDGKAKQGDQRPKTPQTDKLDLGSPKLEPSISKTAVVRERHSPRRRSVFSPDDDIFGGADSSADKKAGTPSKKPSQQPPRTPERLADVNGVVRTVMEAMQHQTTHSDAAVEAGVPSRKVQFDTNSLKALVRRSGELRDALSDIIRRTDQLTQSPARPLRHERDRGPDSSPAFTRVFDDPGSSPPRRVTRSRGNNSLKQTTSPDSSPPPQLERRFPLMTVR